MRLLTAILRVAAFVVMLPVLAQAHAAHDHAERAQAGHVVGVADAHLAAVVSPAPAAIIATNATDRSDCPGCRSCCCGHVFVATADHDPVRSDRLNGRRVAMGTDFARPSPVAEALPEPPRPFA